MKDISANNYNGIKGLVSIITVNFNQKKVTCELLESLKQITYKNVELIVVDNASNEDPFSISTDYPDVIFIRCEKNLGFAGGNNLGLQKAQGEFILFINNDVEVSPDFLEPLINQLSDKFQTAAVSTKI